MRTPVIALALALLAVPLTGCLGIGGGDDGSDQVRKNRADVTEDLGGIEGVVTDEAVQPIEDATVTIVELGETTRTAADGSYAFSRIQPSQYTLRFEASSFVATEQTVTVRAGEATQADVVIAHAASNDAFTQQLELVGFIECGVGWQTDPNPFPGLTQNAVAVCFIPQILPGGQNSTNDRFQHFFDLEAPVDTMVYEIEIPDQGGPLGGTVLSLDMWIQGFVFDQSANVFDNVDARDGHLLRIENQTWNAIARNFTESCQGVNDTEQDDAYCGFNFRDEGWPLTVRAFADGECMDAPVSACAPIQQEFTHVVSTFYNQPAPEGFSVLGGSS